jgi:hypothetical protein
MIKEFVLMLGFVLLVAAAFNVHGKPIAVAAEQGAVITLTDEPCKFTHVVQMPYRITWEEKGKKFEGCFSINQSIIVAYFEDKSIALIPTGVFRPASSL